MNMKSFFISQLNFFFSVAYVHWNASDARLGVRVERVLSAL